MVEGILMRLFLRTLESRVLDTVHEYPIQFGQSQSSLWNTKRPGSSVHFLHSAGLASFLLLKITGGGNAILRALDRGSDFDNLLSFF